MGLGDLEAEHFHYLVQLDKAGNVRLKKFCQRKLKELKEASLKVSNRVNFKAALTDEQKSIFYSSALYSSIHLFTSLNADGVTTDEIAARFEISRAKTQELLRIC